MINVTQISLRIADERDRRFCYEVKRAALREYVEPIWGWDEHVQEEFHLNDWRQRKPSVVVFSGRDIGTIEFVRATDHFHLGEFYLLPEFHRQGIGSHLLTRFLREADSIALPVRLEVIQINPARSLYLRAGFVETGTTKTHCLMERRPDGAGASA